MNLTKREIDALFIYAQSRQSFSVMLVVAEHYAKIDLLAYAKKCRELANLYRNYTADFTAEKEIKCGMTF